MTPRAWARANCSGRDGADVLEPQPVVVARISLQRFLVHVQDGVDTGVALHVAGHLPALRVVGADDLGQLLAGVVGASARTGRHTDGAGGLGVQVREGQVDVADPGRAVHPDLDADLTHHVVAVVRRGVGVQRGGGHLVGPQPDGQLVAHLLEHRPEHRIERHLRAHGQPGLVQPGAFGEQHRRVVARVDRPAQ